MSSLAPPRLTSLALALEASLLSEDFADFAKAAWHVLEPSTPLKWDWALDAICEHLEAVSDGEITHLLINVPPGCMKSLLVGVMWPAWEWTNPTKRHYRYLGTSHKEGLAVRDNLKCRRLIQSEWYRRRWPEVVLVSDQNAKTKFENADTGFRESMSFTSMTGSRGDRVILDDPLSVDDALSEAELLNAKTTFLESLPTRVNNEMSAIVVIMQRLHEEDTAGIILEKKLPYVHLMLPMRFEPERRCSTVTGFSDPRKKLGELLFPSRFSEKTVKALETVLGTYATAGQLQQRPSPRGGGMFKDKYLKLWNGEIPDFEFVIQSYDTAFTDKTANDPTACTVWGVFKHPTRKINCALLLDAWDEHLVYTALRKRVTADWTAVYGGRKGKNKVGMDDLHPGRRPDAVLVENKGSGISLLQDLRAATVPALSYNPGKADKFSRASQTMPMYELELFYVMESKAEPTTPVSWAKAFVAQLSKFGPGVTAHDDYVDTLTQAAIFLRDHNLLSLPIAEQDEEDEVEYHGKTKRNPYD